MKRIKYVDSGFLIRSQPIFCFNEYYSVNITKISKSYFLQDSEGQIIYKSGAYLDVNKAKREAKQMLIEMGAIFYDEVRNTEVI